MNYFLLFLFPPCYHVQATTNLITAQQQAAPLLHSGRSNQNVQNRSTNMIFRLFTLFLNILRILLWPVHYISNVLFPFQDTDGLAPAVTAKVAQQFVSYLQSLANNNQSIIDSIGTSWSTVGFAALKQEAITTQSLIFVYLHSPLHSDSNLFCQTVLIRDPILSFVQQDRVLAVAYSIHSAQGAQLQYMLQVTAFPAIAVLQPSGNSTLQLILKAQGISQCRTQVLMPLLQVILQRHQITLSEVEMRRLQRQQESDLRRQQDDEYQATLAADQERERINAAERNAVLVAAAAEQEAQRMAEQAASDALQAAKNLLRPEPNPNSANTTVVRFVLPTGTKLNRRFESDETIAAVRAYLQIFFVEHDMNIRNIGLSTNFPRQTFTSDDDHKTLVESGFVPQVVLMVQDLDA
jgi:FAS-associated factor 2